MIKKLFKILHNVLCKIIKVIGIIIGLITLTFIVAMYLPFYDYGINKSEFSLEYPDFYPSEQHLEHNFAAVLHMNNGREWSQHNVTFYIHHLRKPLSGKYKKERVKLSYITVPIRKEYTITIQKITLKHTNTNGSVIPPIENNWNEFTTCLNKPTGWCVYKQIYDASLPNKLIENIDMKYTINGKEYELSRRYPLEYAYHYSLWDILMGV